MKAIHARLDRVEAMLHRRRPPQGPQVIRFVGQLPDGGTVPGFLLHVGGRTSPCDAADTLSLDGRHEAH
ncbi:MAG: hypothetical protein L6Q75_19675 [Burkholderiaceae bacterium]|nr:hypothetical protein [Burkholderiaceae bacterium]